VGVSDCKSTTYKKVVVQRCVKINGMSAVRRPRDGEAKMSGRNAPPKYRCRIIRGKNVAYLTLRDSVTKRKRDYFLGPYGSIESRTKYAKLIAAWEAGDRRIPSELVRPIMGRGYTVAQIAAGFIDYVSGRNYHHTHVKMFRSIAQSLVALCGHEPAVDFTPAKLRMVRQALIDGSAPVAALRKSCCRLTANRYTAAIVRMFGWAESEQHIPVGVTSALERVESLRPGEGGARESVAVPPVKLEHVEAIRPYLSRHIAAMVDLQLATGMRSGELVIMRAIDIDMTGDVWVYSPPQHKTSHRGQRREIYIGERGKDILSGFLQPNLHAYIFSPADATAELLARRHDLRKTPAGQGNEMGTNRAESPLKQPGDHYTSHSYYQAIVKACDKADAAAKRAIDADRNSERLVPRWRPHQLRHYFATEVRRLYDLPEAQAALGHKTMDATQIYAKINRQLGIKVARQIG